MDAETRCCGGVLEESVGVSLVEKMGQPPPSRNTHWGYPDSSGDARIEEWDHRIGSWTSKRRLDTQRVFIEGFMGTPGETRTALPSSHHMVAE